jgi:hypothetical protein
MYGYPSDAALAKVAAGLAVLGGCVVRPDMADSACPQRHRWQRATRPAGRPSPDLSSAERAYRAALSDSVAEHGEDGPHSRVLRHALAIVMAADGRPEEARAEYEAAMGVQPGERLDRIEEAYRLVRRAARAVRRPPPRAGPAGTTSA